ncbi:hypothetical protein JAAARDRAFT_540425 [Jaapia argillacea MUCL 33604]|uniref:Uncharacterized protein n=1 Tax=Jaapia argillacea MUCL 33604 TaxID=933084 RepID=A0A067PB20_9AGAM|nr:hypothetical protein JAAARDRAFT_540425 [Jaapia argillacea MUCL 33604]
MVISEKARNEREQKLWSTRGMGGCGGIFLVFHHIRPCYSSLLRNRAAHFSFARPPIPLQHASRSGHSSSKFCNSTHSVRDLRSLSRAAGPTRPSQLIFDPFLHRSGQMFLVENPSGFAHNLELKLALLYLSSRLSSSLL